MSNPDVYSDEFIHFNGQHVQDPPRPRRLRGLLPVRHRRAGGGGDPVRTIELPWADFTTDEDLSWQRFARCHETDPDAFFPEKGGSNAAAKRICAACGVQQLCLEFALTHPETGKWGIWGGTSEPERRRMRADRKNLKEAA